MESIIVRLHALNWTMGEFAYFDIGIEGEAHLNVDWGDGKSSVHTAKYDGEMLCIEHDYGIKAKYSEEHFMVTIRSIDSSIKYLHTGCIDIAIDDIDFSASPSIEALNMSWLGEIDLSPLINLKYLECHGSKAEILDLQRNINLRMLDCRFSNVRHLRLSRCNQLQEIDCSYCHNLQGIALSKIPSYRK